MWTGIDYLGEAHWHRKERIKALLQETGCIGREELESLLEASGFEKDGYYFYHFFNAVSK